MNCTWLNCKGLYLKKLRIKLLVIDNVLIHLNTILLFMKFCLELKSLSQVGEEKHAAFLSAFPQILFSQ